jgi:G:T/U-mismatch repair DNA glycosylase
MAGIKYNAGRILIEKKKSNDEMALLFGTKKKWQKITFSNGSQADKLFFTALGCNLPI